MGQFNGQFLSVAFKLQLGFKKLYKENNPFLVFCFGFQSKKKFERECKEAEKSQITFERLDNDINATKSDVERVRGACSNCL